MEDRIGEPLIFAHLRALLDEHPGAHLVALDPLTLEGRPDAVAPLGIPVDRILDPMAMLQMVHPDDQPIAINHSLRVATEGAIREVIRLADGSSIDAHLYDLREDLGIYVGVTVPLDGETARSLTEAGVRARRRLPVRVAHVEIGGLGEVVSDDGGAREMFGWDEDRLGDLASLDLVHPDDRLNLVTCFIGAIGAPDGTDRGRGRILTADGGWLWTELSFRHRLEPDGTRRIAIELVDISIEMAAHDERRARERLLDRLTNALPIGVAQLDRDGGVRFVNDRIEPLTGVPDPATVDDLFSTVVGEDHDRLMAAVDRALLQGEDLDLEVRITPAPKAPDRVTLTSLRPLHDDDGTVTGAVVCIQDVTEQAMARADLETRALLDPLTRTLNRDGLMAALRRYLGEAEDGIVDPFAAIATTVVFIDLDGFKRVNDTFGHGEGDRVLRLAVERLRSAVRDHDLVGRIGGDEFVAICPGISRPVDALAVADRIASLLARAIPGSEHLRLRASVGVAIGAPGERTAETLLAEADAAMYESKRAGLGRPVMAGL